MLKHLPWLVLAGAALGYLQYGPPLQTQAQQTKHNLCHLKETRTANVRAVVTAIDPDRVDRISLIDPATGCTGVLLASNLNLKLQRGISFTATVQGGFLKSPTGLRYEDNLGTLVNYQEQSLYIVDKPRFTRYSQVGVADFYDNNGKKIPLYITKKQALNLVYKTNNALIFDSNNTIISIN